MTDKDFLQPDPEELLKEFQELRQKKTRKKREEQEDDSILLSSDENAWHQHNVDAWYQSNLKNWYQNHEEVSDYEDDGGYDQPLPDIYFQTKIDLLREKITEVLMLLLDFYAQTMLDSLDDFVDEVIVLFMMKLYREIVTR